MRYKHGYICLVAYPDRQYERMFGQNAGSCDFDTHYENLESSNLAMFLTLQEAERGRRQLSERKDLAHCTITIAELVLWFAETSEEVYREFPGQDHLVVIVTDPDFRWCKRLYGRITQRAAEGVMPGSPMFKNGFRTINRFESALFIAKEWNRQGKSPTTIGQFFLKRL